MIFVAYAMIALWLLGIVCIVIVFGADWREHRRRRDLKRNRADIERAFRDN